MLKGLFNNIKSIFTDANSGGQNAASVIKAKPSIFTDQTSVEETPDATIETRQPAMVKQLFGAPSIEYKRTEKIKEAPAPAPEKVQIKIPAVKESVTDIYGQYDILDTGTTVRPVREKLRAAIENVYAKVPTIEPGIVEAILMKESSMGTNSASKNPDIGKYAWLVGMTKIAKKELIRNGFVPDLDTPEGAIEAAARYWDLKDDTFENAMDAYNHWYSSGKLLPEQLQEFDDMVKYYANNKTQLAKI